MILRQTRRLLALIILMLCCTVPMAGESLDSMEESYLEFMREEEKLARDVYLVFYEEYGEPVFDNIADSEQTHMDAILGLLNSYGLPDPALPEIGLYTNQELQALYDTLVKAGSGDVVSALYVAALIEETDMEDIVYAMENTDNPDIIQVYENLLAGSRNHLRAFVGRIESLGLVYEAQVLTQEEVDEILDSPTERGSRAVSTRTSRGGGNGRR